MHPLLRTTALGLSLAALSCTVPGTLDFTSDTGAEGGDRGDGGAAPDGTRGEDASDDAGSTGNDTGSSTGDDTTTSSGGAGSDTGGDSGDDTGGGSGDDTGSDSGDDTGGDSGDDTGDDSGDDTGGGSGSPDDGPSRCDDHDYALCESFESQGAGQPADPGTWSTGTPGPLVIDDARAARGQNALRVEAGGVQTTNVISTLALPSAVRQTMWGRLFFYVDQRAAQPVQWSMVEAVGANPHGGGTARVRVGGHSTDDGSNPLGISYDIWGTRPEGYVTPATAVPGHDLADGTWHCLEWMFDASNDEARVFLDDDEQQALHVTGDVNGQAADFPASFDQLNIGMATYHEVGAQGWKVAIDEVAVATERVGCDG